MENYGYEVGQRVRLKGAPDVEYTITAIADRNVRLRNGMGDIVDRYVGEIEPLPKLRRRVVWSLQVDLPEEQYQARVEDLMDNWTTAFAILCQRWTTNNLYEGVWTVDHAFPLVPYEDKP